MLLEFLKWGIIIVLGFIGLMTLIVFGFGLAMFVRIEREEDED